MDNLIEEKLDNEESTLAMMLEEFIDAKDKQSIIMANNEWKNGFAIGLFFGMAIMFVLMVAGGC